MLLFCTLHKSSLIFDIYFLGGSSSSYSVNPTNSKVKVGSEDGRCRQPYLYPVGIERLLPVRPPARL
ncbi:hypothetical protein Hanom_Chr13g01232911 [Helianthus anomalus]